MKNIRLYYKKTGDARFISHLDTVRFMTRLIRRANLPVWYTEGFNPHLYITFALPLSLGFKSEYEIADIRLTDDSFPISEICPRLNANSTGSIVFFDAKEPISKLSDLSCAKFKIEFDDNGTLLAELKEFLSRNEISVEKKTKKGDTVLTDIASDIKDFSVIKDVGTLLYITLSAGNIRNINPDLILKKFFSECENPCHTEITRTALLDGNFNLLV